jgi:putative redox protein
MPEQLEEVKVYLTNQKVQFTGVSKSNPDHPIYFDYRPPLGDGQGYNGLELLLMSLSGCIATAMVYLLRKMGKTVSGLEINAKGIRREQPPVKFEKIFLEFLVKSSNTKDVDVQKALQLAEESFCPVWNMIKNNVEVVPSYRIIV